VTSFSKESYETNLKSMKTTETKSVQSILRKHSDFVKKEEDEEEIAEDRLREMLEGEITLTEKER
jgi:ribosome recycling factor